MNRTALVIAGLLWALPVAAEVDIKQVTTEAGHTAWLVEEPSVPFVSLEIRFEGGSVLDPEGREGAVNLMTGLLEEGAGEYDARGFAAAQEALAASFSYDSSYDSVSVSARFLTENRDAAAALLHESLVAPSFEPAAIERVRAQVLSGLRSDANDPDEIAQRRMSELAFGDHPYARPQEGTIESVTGLTRDDLIAAHRASMAQDRVFIGAAGDITEAELSDLIDGLLDGLPAEGAPLPGAAEVTLDGGVTVVPLDVPQSVAVFGQEGIDRHDPDFFAAYVMNQILGGGGFEARLMEEVREKRGLTYGVYSYLATRDHANLVMGRVSSANDRIAESIAVIRSEWERMAEEGVTEDELEQAKTYLTGAYPLRFDGNGAIAGILVGMQMEGLDPDYVNTRNDMVNAVTLDDVKRVAGELMRPGDLRFVVVGQPEGLEASPGQ